MRESCRNKKKELREVAKASRAKFSNHSSDALIVAYALQCFGLSKDHVEFLYENALHFKTMQGMSKLRKQLLQLVFNQNVSGNKEQGFFMESTSENRLLMYEELQVLGKSIHVGWTDMVLPNLLVFLKVES
ncbi:hypothetical protein SLA2020_171490 [Shorea laevis]